MKRNAPPAVRLLHIYISDGHNYFGHHDRPPGDAPMVDVPEVECVAGRGLIGDRFFDYKEDYKGQVTFFDHAVFEELRERFGVFDRDAAAFRRNLVVADADLNTLIGREFELQGVRFLGTQEAAPCHWMNRAFCDGAEEALAGRGGLRAKILTGGVLRAEPGSS